MMYFLLSFVFFSRPCILARYFVFSWDVQALAIVYMTFVIYGQCLWFVFMDLYLWICI
jgi:hypothetical protein